MRGPPLVSAFWRKENIEATSFLCIQPFQSTQACSVHCIQWTKLKCFLLAFPNVILSDMFHCLFIFILLAGIQGRWNNPIHFCTAAAESLKAGMSGKSVLLGSIQWARKNIRQWSISCPSVEWGMIGYRWNASEEYIVFVLCCSS